MEGKQEKRHIRLYILLTWVVVMGGGVLTPGKKSTSSPYSDFFIPLPPSTVYITFYIYVIFTYMKNILKFFEKVTPLLEGVSNYKENSHLITRGALINNKAFFSEG